MLCILSPSGILAAVLRRPHPRTPAPSQMAFASIPQPEIVDFWGEGRTAGFLTPPQK